MHVHLNHSVFRTSKRNQQITDGTISLIKAFGKTSKLNVGCNIRNALIHPILTEQRKRLNYLMKTSGGNRRPVPLSYSCLFSLDQCLDVQDARPSVCLFILSINPSLCLDSEIKRYPLRSGVLLSQHTFIYM